MIRRQGQYPNRDHIWTGCHEFDLFFEHPARPVEGVFLQGYPYSSYRQTNTCRVPRNWMPHDRQFPILY